MPAPIKRKGDKSRYWWLRKKVPIRLRPVIGQAEVWRSLGTTDKRAATFKCAALSAELEAKWKAKEAAALGTNSAPEIVPLERMSHRDVVALAGVAYRRIVASRSDDPGTPLRWIAATAALIDDIDDRDELHDQAAHDFLASEGITLDDGSMARFLPYFVAARADAYRDLERAARGDYAPSQAAARYPERTVPKLDFLEAFEMYVEKGGLKGGKFGPTAKRWRPKIKMFVNWLGHQDLARMTTEDGYKWMDHLIEQGFIEKSVRDVWLASLSATAGFMVERRKTTINPFRGIKVRNVRDGKPDDEKGFTSEQAKIILTATLAGRSHLISAETHATRRWVPWLCAYSGARVSEITSLWPTDVVRFDGIWCIVIKPELEKTEKHRKVPIHRHILDQGFLDFVEQRRKLGKPLFYAPERARGATAGNPQYKKAGERLAEWIHSLGIHGPQPNHGWRHLFKAVARHVGMDREVEGFITGHSTGKTSADYGPRWTKTLGQEIAKYPRFRIAALAQPPTPYKRTRRTRAQIAADLAAKAARCPPRVTA